MLTKKMTQYLSGILVAALLAFLFLQSQIDNSRHEKTLIALLTLLEHDSQLREQIYELQMGRKKNYGGLVVQQRDLQHVLQRLKNPKSPLYLDSSSQVQKLLEQLASKLKQRFDAIESFKRENAVLRNALFYLPKQAQNLRVSISATPNIDAAKKIRIDVLLNQCLTGVLSFENGIAANNETFNLALADLQQEAALLTAMQRFRALPRFIHQAQLIQNLQQSVAATARVAASGQTSRLLKTLYRQYNLDFNRQEIRANQYRLWLFIASVSLLIYLANTFLRLQKTSTALNDSHQELEFHKYAIDEHAIISITDTQGTILYANEKFCQISQYSQRELIGQNHRIVKSDLHDEVFFRQMWNTIKNGDIWHGIFANKARDGSIYWVESTLLPRIGEDGKPCQYIAIRTDITARKEAEEQAQLLTRFPTENPDPVLRINHNGKLLFANNASQILLKSWRTHIDGELPIEWKSIVQRILLTNEQEEHEIRIDNIYYSLLFTPVSQAQYVNLYARDISAIKRAENHLNYQATHDLLTGLNNRYAFEMDLEDTLLETRQHWSESVLLYIDLDQFKIVNDTCGHIAGDELLRQISHLFEDTVRDSDTLARLGGDEFGIILNNCECSYGQQIAADILHKLNEYRFLWDDKSFEIGASIGLVVIDRHCDSIVTLMGDADVACYAAKDAGRNRLQIFQNDQAVAQHRDEIQWASRIPTALSQNQFVLFGQLIKPLNLPSENMTHYELLIRLKTDAEDFIPPGAFIPAAERYGLMQSIDFWVISHAIEALGKHLQQFPASKLRIGVNLSGQSIGNAHLLDYIPELIEKYQLDPACVTFEITETAAIANLTQAIKFIRQLKQNGHYFALDDFGSGLSSFSYLKNLPVDFLKIDGAFIKDILQDPADDAMVQAINQIGHVMNISTIAEFVENGQVEQRLRSIGIDYAQGYHIERPRPFDQVLQEDARRFNPHCSPQ